MQHLYLKSLKNNAEDRDMLVPVFFFELYESM